jgi:hypothetical protein
MNRFNVSNLKTFFLVFEISPTTQNMHYGLIESGFALCMLVEESPQDAYRKAIFLVKKTDWEINKLEQKPVEITEDQCKSRIDNLQQYHKAQTDRVAIEYILGARIEARLKEPVPLRHNSSNQFDLNNWLKKGKKLSDKGRCLHFDQGKYCNEIISSHSIQKNQSLSAIADNGHVYEISRDIGNLKKNNGRISYKKSGINKVSTFLGFCKKHDNELFEPIDNSVLRPTDQQVFLYAYRSLCRELFVKQNAFDLIESQLKNIKINQAVRDFLESSKRGEEFGLNNLKAHKFSYDKSLSDQSYSDIKYTLFISKQKPSVVFSGLFYPDYDFMGRQLQNLADQSISLSLITICFAPMNNSEWGFIFAWHKSSSVICDSFMESLATMIFEDKKIGDLLFRLIMLSCENIAISPKWWETLSSSAKEQISEWEFDQVITNVEQ